MNFKSVFRIVLAVALCMPNQLRADEGKFDMVRWESILDGVRSRAASENISQATIDDTLRMPVFVPSVVKSDKNQSEFKLSLNEYLDRTVNQKRIENGKKMRVRYPTMLSRVEHAYGVPPHVILAFWGMESNYGEVKSRHKLTNAFLSLMYDGRRETFFTNQLIALMKIADKNKLNINDIRGSWAGAMGHFQFIPTTLAQYGVDGNGDKRIDIIGSVGDAMFSAGNYLSKLGWNENERIARRVVLPADFDTSLLKGDVKKPLSEWAAMGVVNPDGSPIPTNDMVAGLVGDVAAINAARETAVASESPDTDVAPMPVITAYLAYPNFYRIKKWNSSNWYAIAIAELSDKLK